MYGACFACFYHFSRLGHTKSSLKRKILQVTLMLIWRMKPLRQAVMWVKLRKRNRMFQHRFGFIKFLNANLWQRQKETKNRRRSRVVDLDAIISDYDYDSKLGIARLQLRLPARMQRILFVTLVENNAHKIQLRQTPNIKSCSLTKSNQVSALRFSCLTCQ